jgi:N-acetylneuraminic acid mutarotase
MELRESDGIRYRMTAAHPPCRVFPTDSQTLTTMLESQSQPQTSMNRQNEQTKAKSYIKPVFFVLVALSAFAAQDSAFGQGGTWVITDPMDTTRYSHTATLLSDEKILVAGGFVSSVGPQSSAKVYSPSSGTWSAIAAMTTNRSYHTATLLPNGKVLVVGGIVGNHVVLSSAELFDPITQTWTATAPMTTNRSFHTATLLPNGKVLIAGGHAQYFVFNIIVSTSELYDPVTETWTPTGSLVTARSGQTATLLSNGKVLVTGGNHTGMDRLSSAELFDSASGTWAETGELTVARSAHTATLLPNGKVLVAGGDNIDISLSNADVYDPQSGTWTSTGALDQARGGHTATLLPNGKVLVVGGYDHNQGTLSSAELFDSIAGTWVTIAAMITSRANHTATLLADGRVLVAGGYDVPVGISTAEIFTPAPEILLQQYAGLTIIAPVGSTNLIQYLNDLADTDWITLTNMVLPSSPYTIIDYDSPGHPKRFYRALLIP